MSKYLDILFKTLDRLPTLPKVVMEFMNIDEEATDFIAQVERIILSEPGLAAKVLHVVNSPLYTAERKISSIRQAVVRLGTLAVRSLVLDIAVTKIFVPTSYHAKYLWRHNIQTALASRMITKTLTRVKLNPELSYTYGLLHDIGLFVMYEQFKSEFEQIEDFDKLTETQLAGREQEVFGFTHAECGYIVMKYWGLPEDILEVVRHHHDPIEKRTELPPDINQYIDVLQVADPLSWVVSRSEADPEAKLVDLFKAAYRELDIDTWQRISLSPKVLPPMVSQISDQAKLACELLGV